MKSNYWDFTEKERAELTEQEVERLLDFELMQNGILRVEPLVLQEIEPVDVPHQQFYCVKSEGLYTETNIAFARPEDAKAFLALKPVFVSNDYETRTGIAEPIVNPSFTEKLLATRDTVNAIHHRLKSNAAKVQANERASAEWKKQSAEMEKACRGVWDDWQECREKKRHAEKIAKTKAEYLRLTNGDELMANAFLKKAFEGGQLDRSRTFGSDDNIPF